MSTIRFKKLEVPIYLDGLYEVYDGDRLLGRVEKHKRESWRKSGRIRTGFIGYYRFWRAIPDGHNGRSLVRRYGGLLELTGIDGTHYQTRTEAAQDLARFIGANSGANTRDAK